jgi:hypothetical protein
MRVCDDHALPEVPIAAAAHGLQPPPRLAARRCASWANREAVPPLEIVGEVERYGKGAGVSADGRRRHQPAGRLRHRQGRDVATRSRRPRQAGFEPTQEEKDAVKVWPSASSAPRPTRRSRSGSTSLAELRAYVAGTKHDDKTNKKLVRSNMVYATIAAMMPKLYAKNPDIGVTPTDAVPDAQMGT